MAAVWIQDLRRRMILASLAVFLFPCSELFSAEAEDVPSTKNPPLTDRQQLAIDVGVADGQSLRSALSQTARRDRPDSLLARWNAGEMEYHGEWMSIAQTWQQAAADPDLSQYRPLRDRCVDSAGGHEKMARWCQRHGLEDIARVHWLYVLRFNPRHRGALNELGLQWHDGLLLTREEVDRYRENSRQQRQRSKQWKSRAKQWRRALEQEEPAPRRAAHAELKRIRDPEAVAPLLKEFTQENTPGVKTEMVQSELMATLGRIPSPAAARALAESALLSPQEIVRYAAIEQLRRKDYQEYIPLLLSEMRLPVEVSIRSGQAGNSVINRYTYSQEGPGGRQREYETQSSRTIACRRYHSMPVYHSTTRLVQEAYDVPERTVRSHWQPITVCNMGRRWIVGYTTPAYRVPAQYQTTRTRIGDTVHENLEYQARQRDAYQRSQVDATQARVQVEQMNQGIQRRNEQIAKVLTQVTDETLDAFPRSWWNWWRDYVREHPEIDRTGNQRRFYQALMNRKPRGLARGTWIWTLRGRRPVEELRIGDYVLAQNPETGELKYQTVLGVSMPNDQLVSRLEVAGGSITCAPGHVLWTAGFGWQTVADMKVGRRLHGVATESKLSNAIEWYSIDTYDLVVDEFHTYFIGQSGILCHDGTPVGPSHVSLPGYSPAAVAQAAEDVLASTASGE